MGSPSMAMEVHTGGAESTTCSLDLLERMPRNSSRAFSVSRSAIERRISVIVPPVTSAVAQPFSSLGTVCSRRFSRVLLELAGA